MSDTQQMQQPVNDLGYRSFTLGKFGFRRDEYFSHITWPGGSHTIAVDRYLRALVRDIAWSFFYGIVNFDEVFGTINHYGNVDVFAGLFSDGYRKSERYYVENFETPKVRAVFEAICDDWTSEGFDPFAAPEETGSAFGPKHGSNKAAISRKRLTASRMVGMKGDIPLRTDQAGNPVNRHFLDVPQDQPEVYPEPGFEDEVHAFNFFGYLSRSEVTWNPSIVSVVKNSLLCPTTEEFMLPVIHGNDRVEWFIQLSDEIHWDVQDRESGRPRARVIMKAGDVSAMPANIRHQGYSPKRSLLLVWENNDAGLPELYAKGKLKPYPVEF